MFQKIVLVSGILFSVGSSGYVVSIGKVIIESRNVRGGQRKIMGTPLTVPCLGASI